MHDISEWLRKQTTDDLRNVRKVVLGDIRNAIDVEIARRGG
jgi:hypothetical protein